MACLPIVVKLILETTSMWTMSSVPVMVCTYDVNGVQFTEHQIGVSCDKTKSVEKIPDKVLRIAIHNSCSIQPSTDD